MATFPAFNIGTGDQHTGLDLVCDKGDEIYSFSSGRVIFVGTTGGGDTGERPLAVEFVHSTDYTTHYGHVDAVLVNDGEEVLMGQLIALCGDTGTRWPHIHFQLGDHHGEPMDPFYDLINQEESINHWIIFNTPRNP